MASQVARQHIVFTNEICVEFNLILEVFNLSHEGGVDSNSCAIHDEDATTTLVVFWCTIFMGYSGAYHVRAQETVDVHN